MNSPDHHTKNAMIMFCCEAHQVTPRMREVAKRWHLAKTYGMDKKKFDTLTMSETELFMELDEIIEEVERG